jgi:hypothetical protein
MRCLESSSSCLHLETFDDLHVDLKNMDNELTDQCDDAEIEASAVACAQAEFKVELWVEIAGWGELKVLFALRWCGRQDRNNLKARGKPSAEGVRASE